jgi:hypothetical protein
LATGEIRLTWKKIDDCWSDGRRFWCAFCGIPMKRRGVSETSATRDHIVPKAHGGRFVTIPACRKCNQAKADMSLDAFLESDYFAAVRKHRHRHQWPFHELWYALAREAIRQASMHRARTQQSRSDRQLPLSSLPAAAVNQRQAVPVSD